MKQLNFTQDEYLKLRQSGMTPTQIEDLSSKAAKPAVHDFLDTATNVFTTAFPGTKAIGESLGTAALNIGKLAKGQNPDISVNIPKTIGGYLQAGAQVGALGAPLPSTTMKGIAGVASKAAQSAGTFGALSALQTAGGELGSKNTLPETVKNIASSAATGAAVGGVFNLLGQGISSAAQKTGPSALEFTSGVPKAAIQQASKNPNTAKLGLQLSVNEIRNKADTALQTLQKDLNSELNTGLASVPTEIPPNVYEVPNKIFDSIRGFTDKLGLQFDKTPKGIATDFAKTAIVQQSEQNAVKTALQTINGWTDYSPDGMIKLSQRIGALKNFDSSGVTRSSAVVGKIYNAVNEQIGSIYPEVSKLRTNYAVNKEVLDTISQVLNATKDKIGAQQSAVTRLDNIFKENRDLYINAIRELSQRSGTDILSLLAGGEFQKLLPGWIRGIGGGAAVGLGTSFVSPWAILLAPLFSPRGAGVIARNATGAAKTTATLGRSALTRIVGESKSQSANQEK